MKILYAASEAVPFCKTGGLADVAGSLPPALAEQGAETAVILPLYRRRRGVGTKRRFHIRRRDPAAVPAGQRKIC